jgi:hypothetical protein
LLNASFTDILNKYRKNPIPEFLVDMENQFSFKNTPTVKAIHQPFNDLNSYFCIPENSQLIARWDTIADRTLPSQLHNRCKTVNRDITLMWASIQGVPS